MCSFPGGLVITPGHPIRHQGKWIYPNGMYYEGTFENNKPKGDGKWVFKNGNVLNGTYTQKPKELGEGEEEE